MFGTQESSVQHPVNSLKETYWVSCLGPDSHIIFSVLVSWNVNLTVSFYLYLTEAKSRLRCDEIFVQLYPTGQLSETGTRTFFHSQWKIEISVSPQSSMSGSTLFPPALIPYLFLTTMFLAISSCAVSPGIG